MAGLYYSASILAGGRLPRTCYSLVDIKLLALKLQQLIIKRNKPRLQSQEPQVPDHPTILDLIIEQEMRACIDSMYSNDYNK